MTWGHTGDAPPLFLRLFSDEFLFRDPAFASTRHIVDITIGDGACFLPVLDHAGRKEYNDFSPLLVVDDVSEKPADKGDLAQIGVCPSWIS